MDDLESRLRAAMSAAAEPPPPGLMAAIRRRNRRHRKRVAAGSIAMAAAIGLVFVPVTQQRPSRPAPSGARETTSPRGVSPTPAAGPGTVQLACGDSEWGQLSASLQPRAVRVGASPLWLVVVADQAPSLHAVIAEIARPATVTMRVSASSRSYFQLSDQFVPGGEEPLPAGDTGITFASCPVYAGTGTNGKFTDYMVGFILQAGRSATVEVSTPGARHSTPVTFTCPARPGVCYVH